MSDVDYRIQQCDLKLLCNRTHAIDMSKTIMKQQIGAVNLVIRSFLKVHPEYEAWRKYGFWNLRAGVQLILRVSACKSKKLLKSPAKGVKARKPRGKPRAEKAEAPVPLGQPAITKQDVEMFDLDGVVSEDEDEGAGDGAGDGAGEDEDMGSGSGSDEGEDEDEDVDAGTHDIDGVASEDEDEELALKGKELSGDEGLKELEDLGALDVTMANSSWFNDPDKTVNMSVDADGGDEEDDGTFDMSQVTGNSTAGKPAPAAHSITSNPKALLSAPPSATAPATSNHSSAPTTKSAHTSTPVTEEPAPRPLSVPPPARAPAVVKAALPKSTGSKAARNTPPPAQSASTPPAHTTHSSAPPAASRAPVSTTPVGKAASSPPVTLDSALASNGDPAPPARKSTSASTIVWRGMKITSKNMATIRANAAHQAAGDQIRASPIYRDLIDKLAVDPDYDPASEPLPLADAGHTRNATPPPANPLALPPVRAPTVPPSTTMWRGMKISKKQMTTIRANAARQAAGDKIRASPLYQDLIDKLAADPDYDPTSEPLPLADAGHTRNAASPPGSTTAVSAPTDANPPAGKSRAQPKPKPKPIPKPELDVIADDETDSNMTFLNGGGDKVDKDGDSAGASGKRTQNAAGGKGKGVAEGERAPATVSKGKAVAEGERVDVCASTATKKAQGKKAAKETVAKVPAKAPAKKSTRSKK
ncbi:hypothetical protein FS749_004707 [Ceratobasidium sp. UAMH 11750]|nr:hypothetical protein FS749_004707 [Ceratobasidium sp. UAMH 11750]